MLAYPLLAKAPVISTSLVPIRIISEREVFIVKYLREFSNTDARQEVKDIPGVAFREIPMHSLNHLREEFLQLFKHLQMSGRLRKFNSHRQSRLTPEGLIAPHK